MFPLNQAFYIEIKIGIDLTVSLTLTLCIFFKQ